MKAEQEKEHAYKGWFEGLDQDELKTYPLELG